MNDHLLKVILVDDEVLVRDLLKRCVDWGGLGAMIAGEASGASEALAMVDQLLPDLVFTDICMPSMDGIELSELILAKYPWIKVVIITGYEDFDYAKRSIQAGVSEYILKPINDAEIVRVLLKIKAKIAAQKDRDCEYDRLKQQLDRFNFYLKAGMEEQALQLLEQFLQEVSTYRSLSFDQLRMAGVQIVMAILNTLNDLRLDSGPIFEPGLSPYDRVFGMDNIPELGDYVLKLTRQVLAYINETRHRKVNKVIREVQEYLRLNYANSDISQTTVAKLFFVNSSYLSRIFKQAINLTFVEYLTQIRMEKAKQFLQETDLKAYQIAERIGIGDPHYFGICFKKYTGMSVNDYRKAISL
jgi:two-component system response regulator YesN